MPNPTTRARFSLLSLLLAALLLSSCGLLRIGFPPRMAMGDNVTVHNTETGRDYVCTDTERLETCIRRACVESTWGVDNCVARTVGLGLIHIFRARR